MKGFLCCLFISFGVIVGSDKIIAQCTNTCGSNLVPNASFETPTGNCTTSDIQLYTNQTPVQGWFGTEDFNANQMAGSTPDYFSSCAGSTNSANNVCIDGSSRVGFFTHTSFSNGREYVQAQLNSPLVAGKTYCFSMVVKSKVGAAGNVLSSCDGVGAWFHNQGLINIQTMNGGTQFLGSGSTINAQPQVENPSGNLIGGSCVTVTGTFCAQGGEDWIVIGNFRDDANTQISGSNPANYMYIDDLNLFQICSTPLSLDLNADQTNLCPGACTSITSVVNGGSGNYTYSWMPGGMTSDSINICPQSDVTYTLTVTSPNACGFADTITDTVTISVNNCFTGVVATGSGICAGTCANIIAQASGAASGITYNWQPGNLSGSSVSVCPNATTIFTVTASDANGLSFTDTCMVVVNQMPVADAGSDVTICSGNSVTLHGSGGNNFLWNTLPPQSTANITVQPNVVTSYVLTVANGICKDTDTVVVYVTAAPQVSLQSSNITCNGMNDGAASATITGGTQPISFHWNPGNINSTTISGLAAGNYTFSLNDNSGCSFEQSVTISEPAPLTSQISGATQLCAGSSALLSAQVSGGNNLYTYDWHGAGPNAPVITVSPAITTNYNLSVTDPMGCISIASHLIIVDQPPQALFQGSDTACVPVTVSFINQSTGAVSYEWNFGDATTLGIANPTHIYSNAGIYSVTLIAIAANGCADTLVRNNVVEAVAIPHSTLSSSALEVGEYEPVVEFSFESSNAVSCTFDFGDGTLMNACQASDYAHYYKDTGTYCASLISVNSIGCSFTQEICVKVKPEFSFYVPNAFTPNSDGDNDTFTGYGSNFRNFEMWIFDRWGEMIYHTQDYSKPWDGVPVGKSAVAQMDIYVYKITVTDMSGIKKEFTGHLNLIR